MPDPLFPELPHVRADVRPRLERPVLLAAFEGWNDAGDAATTAVTTLGKQWGAESFATIDPEDFYDFTSTRPTVQMDEHGRRGIDWPQNTFAAATIKPGLDCITLVGVEPQLKWRTFCEQVTGLALAYDVSLVVTIGALLSEVPHTRPTPVYGATYEGDDDELGLEPSRYEGPTGIVGVLHAACAEAGLRSASLWAAVPTYVPSAPSPKAALALVQRTARVLGVDADVVELTEETVAYEEQISELVDADEDSREYVEQLEASYDEGPEDLDDRGERLVEEVERFLRDQHD